MQYAYPCVTLICRAFSTLDLFFVVRLLLKSKWDLMKFCKPRIRTEGLGGEVVGILLLIREKTNGRQFNKNWG